MFFNAKHGKALYSQQQKTSKHVVDCVSDHELLIAKFRLKLKTVGEPLCHSAMT